MGRHKNDCVTLRHRSVGGMLSVGMLRALAEWAASHGEQRILLTTRQEIDAPGVARTCLDRVWARFPGNHFEPVHRHTEPNMMSTAAVAGLAPGRAWLVESTFRDILEAIAFRPVFPVTLADPSQPYLPWTTEGLCFFALEEEDRWAVYFGASSWEARPVLLGAVRTGTVARVVGALQEAWPKTARSLDHAELHALLSGLVESCGTPPSLEAPTRFRRIPGAVAMPMPEGGWDAGFIEALCVWAGRSDDAVMRVTPWRSLLLPGLGTVEQDSLAELCLTHRVTMEAPPWRRWLWAGQDAENAAATLTTALDQQCAVNPGYGMAVLPEDASAPAVHRCVRYRQGRFPWVGARYQYRVEGASKGWVDKNAAAEALLSSFGESEFDALAENERKGHEEHLPATKPSTQHRCADCGSAYDAAYGDVLGGIPPHTPFTALPEAWACPTCGAGREAYTRVA